MNMDIKYHVIYFALVCLHINYGECAIRFANSFGDHMVLQRAPKRALLWGYADVIGDTVSVLKNAVPAGNTTVYRNPSGPGGVWKLRLPAESRHGPYSITVSSSEDHVTINDVMFGDVWICSGQSNMQFKMEEVMNATFEINAAIAYPDVRMLFSDFHQSSVPLDDVKVRMPWVKPIKGIIDKFSALCFLYGRNLYTSLGYPIGLIASSWGGTAIETWSSPAVLRACPAPAQSGRRALWPTAPIVLWNSMIHPYLQTTIYGAIWYQGESNAGHPDMYACQFPAMIADWRQRFRTGTDGETDSNFPFGFVQLAPHRPGDGLSGFPALRWAQTAEKGYVPNARMPNTFMAVAVDLPDVTSPTGAIHPRYKQDVATRLVLASLETAYGHTAIDSQGPFPTQLVLDTARNYLIVTFDNGTKSLQVKNQHGFEICCAHSATSNCTNGVSWIPVTITGHNNDSVRLDTSVCPSNTLPAGVRYLWKESPCAFKQCAVYGRSSGLPAPPYIHTGGFPSH